MTATRRLDRLVSWSPVLLLGSLAALTYWLDAQIQPTVPVPDGSKRHDVDLYVESASRCRSSRRRAPSITPTTTARCS